MADVKVTALVEDTSPSFEDLLMMVNDPGGAPASRKLVIYNLLKILGWIDVRVFMDGAGGRPTYANWYANQSTTDTILCFTAAIDTGNRAVFVPDGYTFMVSTPVILKTGTTLFSQGPSALIKALANFGDVPVVRNDTTAPANDAARDLKIKVLNLQIDGNKANNGTGTEFSHCVSMIAVVDFQIESVNCVNPKGDGIYVGGTATVKPERGKILNNTVSGAARQGIAVTNGKEVYIKGNHVSGGDNHGIDFETDAATAIITECIISENIIETNGNAAGDYGIAISDNQTATTRDLIVSNNHVYNQTGCGIGFRGWTGLKICDNIINTTSVDGILEITANTASKVSITGNIIIAATGRGICISNTNGHTISNNQVHAAATGGAILWEGNNNIIMGNMCKDQTTYAFYQNSGINYVRDNISIDGTHRLFELTWNTLGIDDATPSVKGGYLFITANVNPTTITMLDDGFKTQEIRILIKDANTTFDFTGTNLYGNGGADFAAASGDSLNCLFDGTNWFCDVHDNTA